MAQVNIHLESADTAVATVPAVVTVPVGAIEVHVPITAIAYTGSVQLTATYAGKSLTTTALVVLPTIHHGPFVTA
jgi:hypothetical protein